MAISLANLIGPEELLTSSELVKRCVKAGATHDNARQIVRRRSERDGIWRSEKLALPGNGRIFCRQSLKGSQMFVEQLLDILQQDRPGLYRLLNKLQSEQVVLSPHARMLLASPHGGSKPGYPSFLREIDALEEAEVAFLESRDTIRERVVRLKVAGTPDSDTLSLDRLAAFQVELALSKILLGNFRRQNLISWNSLQPVQPNCSLEVFNGFEFFSTAFSFLSPLLRWEKNSTKPKPAPVVVHLCAGRCTLDDVIGFKTRIERAGDNRSVKLKILGILAAREFTEDSFKEARRNGFVVVNLNEYFGNAAFEVIAHVQDLLKPLGGEPDKVKVGEYSELAEELERLKTHPMISDLRGLAFEALAGLLIKNEGWEEVQLNLSVPYGNSNREVDVSGQKDGWEKICIIECKAELANKPLDPAYVRKFFGETVPAFISAKCPGQKPASCRAEIWSTGTIDDAAFKALDEFHRKKPKYIDARLLERADLIDSLPKTMKSTKKLIETIANFGPSIRTDIHRSNPLISGANPPTVI